ncbi:hypothetical protein JCM11491_003188 [Sporobolomyces phaffii]
MSAKPDPTGDTSNYWVDFTKPGNDLAYSSKTKLEFAKATCDLRIADASSGATPDKFTFEWKMTEPYRLDHDLESFTVFTKTEDRKKKTKTTFPFARPVACIGYEGRVSFSHLVPEAALAQLSHQKLWFATLQLRRRTPSDASVKASYQQYATNDVVFVFPSDHVADAASSRPPPRQLWASSTKLQSASPYFEALFDSEGFAETENQIPAPVPSIERLRLSSEGPNSTVATYAPAGGDVSKGNDDTKDDTKEAPATSAAASDELDHEDSDVEDDLYPAPAPSPAIHRIVVRQVAYRTLAAFLHYLETGTIRFCPLSSSFPPPPPPPPSASTLASAPRRRTLPPSSSVDVVPSCSPKSMYLLADLYEHAPLRKLAFDAWAVQLGANNALAEYLSDLATAFAAVRKTALDAVLDNWDVIKGSDELRALRTEVEQGTLEPHKVRAVFELFDQLKPI